MLLICAAASAFLLGDYAGFSGWPGVLSDEGGTNAGSAPLATEQRKEKRAPRGGTAFLNLGPGSLPFAVGTVPLPLGLPGAAPPAPGTVPVSNPPGGPGPGGGGPDGGGGPGGNTVTGPGTAGPGGPEGPTAPGGPGVPPPQPPAPPPDGGQTPGEEPPPTKPEHDGDDDSGCNYGGDEQLQSSATEPDAWIASAQIAEPESLPAEAAEQSDDFDAVEDVDPVVEEPVVEEPVVEEPVVETPVEPAQAPHTQY